MLTNKMINMKLLFIEILWLFNKKTTVQYTVKNHFFALPKIVSQQFADKVD